MKNLEHNTWAHSLQFIYPIVVAIFIFLTRHVTQPELLFRDPILYVSLVQNASGIVMLQFLQLGYGACSSRRCRRSTKRPPAAVWEIRPMERAIIFGIQNERLGLLPIATRVPPSATHGKRFIST